MDLNNLAVGLKRPSYRTHWEKIGDHNRLISAPNKSMRQLQKRLIRYLRKHAALELWLQHATAERGRGWVENARRVRHCRYFYKTDLSSAFESIRLEQLVWALKHTIAGIGEIDGTMEFVQDANIANFLERWCMNDPAQGSTGLRRGPNSSPILTDLLFALLFDFPTVRSINEYCHGKARVDGTFDHDPRKQRRAPIEYVRYVDDIVLAMQELSPLPWKFLHRQIRDNGFQVNHKKTKILDIEQHPVVITGVGIQPGGRLYIPRELVERTHALMHRVVMGLPVAAETYPEIRGLMEAFYLVTNENNSPYNMIEAKLHWLYEIYKLYLRLSAAMRRRAVAPEVAAIIDAEMERVSQVADGNATELAKLQRVYQQFGKRPTKLVRR